MSVVWLPGISKSSYPELEGLHPLSHHLVLWDGGVGHLELEQVIASWSIAVLVKHNRGASAACTEQERENAAKGQQNRKVLDAGVTGCSTSSNKRKTWTFNPLPLAARWPTWTTQRGVFESVPPSYNLQTQWPICETFIIITDREASSLLTNITLPHLLPMHRHSWTMATGRKYFHIQNTVRYADSNIRSSLLFQTSTG